MAVGITLRLPLSGDAPWNRKAGWRSSKRSARLLGVSDGSAGTPGVVLAKPPRDATPTLSTPGVPLRLAGVALGVEDQHVGGARPHDEHRELVVIWCARNMCTE